MALNLHLRAIPKLHLPRHAAIELGEIRLGAGHVVAGAGVQVPPLLHLTAYSSEKDLGARIIEVDALRSLPMLCNQHLL